MILLRQSEFSDSKKKLSSSDKLRIWTWKNLSGRKGRDLERAVYDDDPEIAKEAVSNVSRKYAKEHAISAATLGGVVALGAAHEKGISHIPLKYGLPLAAAAAAIDYPISKALKKRIMNRRVKKLQEEKDLRQKYRDTLDVADGWMSKEDFIEKYGK